MIVYSKLIIIYLKLCSFTHLIYEYIHQCAYRPMSQLNICTAFEKTADNILQYR